MALAVKAVLRTVDSAERALFRDTSSRVNLRNDTLVSREIKRARVR